MNTLATFSSPLGSLHFANPAATSALLEEASSHCAGKFFGGGGASSPAPAGGPSESSSLKTRFTLRKRSSAAPASSWSSEMSASATSRPRRLEISSPVLLSSSNPIAYGLCAVPRDANSQVLDVPRSPTLSLASRDSRDFVLAPPPYTPIAAKERSLVDAQEIERRLSQYDGESSQGIRAEMAARDGRIGSDLRRMGL